MKAWFVVRIKTGAEERAAWHLKNQGFEAYLPKYSKVIRHARKTQTVVRSMFPGYLFVCMDIEQQRWRSINGTMGVITLVQFGETPCAISGSVVDAIRLSEVDGIVNLAPVGLRKGDRVRVRDGAFVDREAILEEYCDRKRVVLLLDLLGREVRVTVPSEDLVAIF